jgi:hypothetical protein
VTPEMKERVLATVNELIDDDDLPFGDEDPLEPRCWGLRSYEHYSGECRHFEEEEDDDGPDPDYEFERRWDDGEGR